MFKSPSKNLAGFILTLLGAIFFSTKAIIVKKAYLYGTVDPIQLLALRMLFSIPFYVGAIWVSKRQTSTQLTTKQWVYIIGLGLMGYYFSSLFDFLGLQYISAGLERLILFLYPTFAVLINYFVFKQAVNRLQKQALILTYIGIVLAFYSELQLEAESSAVLKGSGLVLLCAITYSIYIVGSGRMVMQHKVNVTQFTAYAMLSATAGVLVHFALRGNYRNLVTDHGLWIYGFLLAIFATVIPSFLLASGMKRLQGNDVAIILAVGPVATIFQAYWFLGETINALQIVGTLLVIAGVVLVGWRRGK